MTTAKTSRKAQSELKKLRREIDAVDRLFMKVLACRFKVVRKVGRLKLKNNLPIIQQGRMQEMLDGREQDASRLNLDRKLIYKIFDLIHDASIECQKQIAAPKSTPRKIKKVK